MGRLNQLPTWQRLSAIGVVTVVIAGVLVWLRPDDRQPAPPFPEIGFVQEGDDMPHTVVHRTVEPHIGDGSVTIADQETLTWDGSMALDDTEMGGYDRTVATAAGS